MSFELANLQRAQYIAKTAMDEIYSFIHVGVSAQKIRGVAENAMIKLGSEGWWMRGDPALVLIGDDTANSGSFDAKAQRARCTVAENDIISVDVAPSYRGMWGDFARTFFVEDAKVTMHPQKPKSLHFSRMLEL
ncbi:MAG: M24 family metallopeptidase, partial [Oscillospiraceae bacterium]